MTTPRQVGVHQFLPTHWMMDLTSPLFRKSAVILSWRCSRSPEQSVGRFCYGDGSLCTDRLLIGGARLGCEYVGGMLGCDGEGLNAW